MEPILVASLLVACSLLLWLWKRKSLSPLSQIYQPPTIPFTGIPYDLLHANTGERLMRWMKHAGSHGLVRIRGFTGEHALVVYSQDLIKQILVTKCTKFRRSDYLKVVFPVIGDGIFSSNGPLHMWQKKLMMPLFSYASTKKYTKCFDDNTNNLCQVWTKIISAGIDDIEVHGDLALLTMDIFGDAAFSYKFNGVLHRGNEITAQFNKVLHGRLDNLTALIRSVIPFFDYLPLKVNIEYKEAARITNGIINEIIEKKREALHQEKEDHSTSDLLTTLIEARDESSGKCMDDQLLRENMWTLLLAGYETTSVALTWILYHLALHGDVQEKAREEVTRIVGASETILAEHVDQFEYVTCVVKESLRLTPSVPEFFRDCKTEHSFNSLIIPSGTGLLIPILAMHRCHTHWEEPNKFIPDRFLHSDNPRLSGISGQTYLPFSTGPRSCLGAKFAMQEMKTVLARLLMTFRFSLDEQYRNIGNRVSITMRPHPPPKFKLTLVQQPS